MDDQLEDRLLTTSEAARRIGVHPKTLTLWAREGRIPALVTPGGHRRFRAEDIDALVQPLPGGETKVAGA